MRSVIWLLAVLALTGGSGLAPALGTTIEPGTYTMEWRIPEAGEDVSFGGRVFAALAPADTGLASNYKGLSSSKGLYGGTSRYTVFLDESKGTGTGYDTAYVLEGELGESECDLTADAFKIKLKKQDGLLQSAESSGPVVDLTIGEEGSQITKKAVLGVDVHMSGEQPQLAMLVMRGGWYGTLKTDKGDLDVQLIDVNSNGIYGDKVSANADQPYPNPGDVVLIGGMPTRFEDYGNLLYLGDVVSYGGKLYEMSVSKTGETIDVQSYTSPVGKLRIEALDGRGKPSRCSTAMLFGNSGMFSTDGGELTVPPGEYRWLTAGIVPTQEGPEEKHFGITVQPKSTVKVTKGKTAVTKIGGPMKVEIAPGMGVITVSQGGMKMIQLSFTVGGDELGGVMGNRMAWVNIRDRKGKLLSSKQSGFGRGGACAYSVRIPKDWKPGTYSIGVSFDPSPYQKTIYAKKKIKVVK